MKAVLLLSLISLISCGKDLTKDRDLHKVTEKECNDYDYKIYKDKKCLEVKDFPKPTIILKDRSGVPINLIDEFYRAHFELWKDDLDIIKEIKTIILWEDDSSIIKDDVLFLNSTLHGDWKSIQDIFYTNMLVKF